MGPKKADCAGGCGRRVKAYRWYAPPGGFMCAGCRRSYRESTRVESACESCGAGFSASARRRRFCSRDCWYASGECGNRSPVRPSEWSGRKKRQWLRAVAQGLTQKQRELLLARWVRAGVGCAYCDGPCESVDHVVPLSRGGTNFEGNLAPCCLRCNSSKCDLLLVEWLFDRRHRGTVTDRPWLRGVPVRPVRRTSAVKPQRLPRAPVACRVCGCEFVPRSKRHACCSELCGRNWSARVTRAAYRAKHGIPLGMDQDVWSPRRAS